jgi:SAM-dependent methyltransferase
VNNPVFARIQARAAAIEERRGGAERRRQLLAGLEGRVVEVGAGSGVSFAHYPAGVDELVAVEPEPHLRELASAAAVSAPVPVRVVDGLAERLPVDDGWADAVVMAGVLCSLPDPRGALDEVARVLRPGGELRFYEHVGGGRMLLRAASPAYRVFGGCHLARDTEAAIRAAGFAIDRIERFAFRERRWEPAIPHILGRAYPA